MDWNIIYNIWNIILKKPIEDYDTDLYYGQQPYFTQAFT